MKYEWERDKLSVTKGNTKEIQVQPFQFSLNLKYFEDAPYRFHRIESK